MNRLGPLTDIGLISSFASTSSCVECESVSCSSSLLKGVEMSVCWYSVSYANRLEMNVGGGGVSEGLERFCFGLSK